MSQYIPYQFAVVIIGITYLVQQLSGSYFSRSEFWQEGMSDEKFRMEVDAHIERLRSERSRLQFGQTLPLPIRVGLHDVPDLKLSSTGRLSFSAPSDRHDFAIGLF